MAKGKTKKIITILWGLPGSGKTTFAKENGTKSILSYLDVIDVDTIARRLNDKNKINDSILDHMNTIFHSKHTSIIIDGLFTTNAQVRTLMDRIINKFDNYDLVFKIEWWEEDRATCIWNDKGRREQDSVFSINNLTFEVPDIKMFPELIPSRIKKHKVVRRSDARNWALESGLQKYEVEAGVLKSSEWSLGGTFGNCYGGKSTREAEPQPDFSEFESLIEKVCPDISYLTYKKIASECCKIVTSYDNDYYGGSWSNACHECDIEKLYSILKEKGYIKEEN